MTGAADTHLSPATGTGSLDLARGTSHLTGGTVELRGEQDIFGVAFDSRSWAAESLAGTSWTGGTSIEGGGASALRHPRRCGQPAVL